MLATSREAAGELVAAFRGRRVQKYYVALTDRKPSKKMGSVVGDMEVGRCAAHRMRWRRLNVGRQRLSRGGLGCLLRPPPRPVSLAPQKGRRGSWMLARTTDDPAVTRFTSAAVPGRPGLRALLLKPETGRTHQARCEGGREGVRQQLASACCFAASGER